MTHTPPLVARPTTYNGIEMRSRLEGKYAAWLDQHGFDWEYEPRAFASEVGQYLPDFRTTVEFVGSDREAYIEVKPTRAKCPGAYMQNCCRIVWASAPEALMLFEVAEAELTAVFLPPSWGFSDPLWCRWIASEPRPHLGALASQGWRQ